MSSLSATPTDPTRHPGPGLRDPLLAIAALMALLVVVEWAVPVTSPAPAASTLDAVAVVPSPAPG
jgi:hypothetical protein